MAVQINTRADSVSHRLSSHSDPVTSLVNSTFTPSNDIIIGRFGPEAEDISDERNNVQLDVFGRSQRYTGIQYALMTTASFSFTAEQGGERLIVRAFFHAQGACELEAKKKPWFLPLHIYNGRSRMSLTGWIDTKITRNNTRILSRSVSSTSSFIGFRATARNRDISRSRSLNFRVTKSQIFDVQIEPGDNIEVRAHYKLEGSTENRASFDFNFNRESNTLDGLNVRNIRIDID